MLSYCHHIYIIRYHVVGKEETNNDTNLPSSSLFKDDRNGESGDKASGDSMGLTPQTEVVKQQKETGSVSEDGKTCSDGDATATGDLTYNVSSTENTSERDNDTSVTSSLAEKTSLDCETPTLSNDNDKKDENRTTEGSGIFGVVSVFILKSVFLCTRYCKYCHFKKK